MVPRHGGGPRPRYAEEAQRRILAEVNRPPDRERDGTATWTLSTLQAALRRLHEAGLSWQRTRTWCSAGTVVRTRKHGGVVTVTDGDAAAKKS